MLTRMAMHRRQQSCRRSPRIHAAEGMFLLAGLLRALEVEADAVEPNEVIVVVNWFEELRQRLGN